MTTETDIKHIYRLLPWVNCDLTIISANHLRIYYFIRLSTFCQSRRASSPSPRPSIRDVRRTVSECSVLKREVFRLLSRDGQWNSEEGLSLIPSLFNIRWKPNRWRSLNTGKLAFHFSRRAQPSWVLVIKHIVDIIIEMLRFWDVFKWFILKCVKRHLQTINSFFPVRILTSPKCSPYFFWGGGGEGKKPWTENRLETQI